MADTLTLNRALQFPNGTFVYDSSGNQIDPKSTQGQEIIAIWNQQAVIRNQNTQQKIQFAWDTYPRDPQSRAQLLTSWGLDPNSPAPTGNSSS